MFISILTVVELVLIQRQARREQGDHVEDEMAEYEKRLRVARVENSSK